MLILHLRGVIMINIVICEDDLSYQEVIVYKIKQCMHTTFKMDCEVSCFHSLSNLKQYIDNNKVDILFLDIMVNDENAMDWSIENIKSNYTQIIFMTSFPQCAYNISESNCCYYLVKSKITEENLYKALQRALQNTAKKDPNLTIVKSRSKNHIVNLQNLQYIETFNNNITLHLQNNDSITIYSSLKEYAETLPPNFLRCHKCYLINMNHITGYEPHKFIINSGQAIPIPPKKYNKIIEIYKLS